MTSSRSTRPQPTSNLPIVTHSNPAWHTLTIDRTLAQLDINAQTGLTDRRIAQLQQEFGANELVAAVVKPPKQN